MSRIIIRAPTWSKPSYEVGQVGRPFNQFLNWPMVTRSGAAFFLNHEVNAHRKKVFCRWGSHLNSPASASALNKSDWLSLHVLSCIAEAARLSAGTPSNFEDIYMCDPSKLHHGYLFRGLLDSPFPTRYTT
ncbi:hypothetical protein N7532_005451 [Penicillium argentinense]|uniref:L-tryptophan decarboxylase PsiD-like domain-containing protein n=1 Tax=Penicillium argentinense TaxID=1131581 RepID=A0A9W9FDY2_9EURO|nr:uncharacterized protein N7532_005451 [Penicillium argentinense]KAJ5098450.1 hypothetical protein N7532_005451 [Penicillium argentinense]